MLFIRYWTDYLNVLTEKLVFFKILSFDFSDLQIAKSCLADYIKTECPFAIGVAEHTTGIYDAYLELCNEDEWN